MFLWSITDLYIILAPQSFFTLATCVATSLDPFMLYVLFPTFCDTSRHILLGRMCERLLVTFVITTQSKQCHMLYTWAALKSTSVVSFC